MHTNVLIIPFRDREEHLDYFIKNTAPLIEKYLPNTKIVVVEQNKDKLFNRGALLNIGFKEYENKTEFFFTHDVDMNPSNDIIRNIYSQKNNDVLRIRSAHHESLGGVVKFKHDVIFDINGFPNNIWGWGIEDRALFYKCYIKNINVINYTGPQYFHILPHKSNENMNYVGDKKKISDMWKKTFIDKLNDQHKLELIQNSGVSNLKYSIIERENIHDIVEVIRVEI